MSKKDLQSENNADVTDAPNLSRRALLKGTVKAMPVVLTLQSGAAFARSSNMISATGSGYKDGYGRSLCLDTSSVTPADGSATLYDMGEPAFGSISAINDRDFQTYPFGFGKPISEARMCERGGTYYYRSGSRWQWRRVSVRKGVLVSATALSSFAGNIVVTDL